MTKRKPSSFVESGDSLRTNTKTVLSPQSMRVADSKATVRVAYRKGPPEITFFRRQWKRDVVQTIPIDDWVAMNKRPDIVDFNFSEVYEAEER